MRRWRVTFSRHPDSARDGAGRGTGRRPAAGAAPLSGQGLRGWDLPSAHRRQAPTACCPGPALSARRPGALITQPREAGTARRLLAGKERGLRVTGGQGHRPLAARLARNRLPPPEPGPLAPAPPGPARPDCGRCSGGRPWLNEPVVGSAGPRAVSAYRAEAAPHPPLYLGRLAWAGHTVGAQ